MNAPTHMKRPYRPQDNYAEQAKATEQCQTNWKSAVRRENHGYLADRGLIPPERVPVLNNRLLIPLMDIEQEIHSLQYIYWSKGKNGYFKQLHSGGAKSGHFCPIGDVFNQPEQLYVCEGYATGLTIHLASGSPVVVAIDAGNLKHVVPRIREKFPDTEIVICADNDDAPEKGQNIGLDTAKSIAKQYPLTGGLTGDSTEDFHKPVPAKSPVPTGRSPVSTGTFNPVGLCWPKFDTLEVPPDKHPTDFDDVRQLLNLEEVRKQLEKVWVYCNGELQLKPEEKPEPWTGVLLPEDYEIKSDGVYKVNANSNTFISAPCWISAHTEDPIQGVNGFELQWIDRKGKQRSAAFPQEVLHERGNSFAMKLTQQGLKLGYNRARALEEYLNSFPETRWIHSASQVGWVENPNNQLIFVLPNRIIGNEGGTDLVFQSEGNSVSANTIRQQGTLADWNKYIARLCEESALLLFSALIPFAAVIHKASGEESGGFNLWGRTSRGKTTAAQVGASVFGCGADPSQSASTSHVRKWDNTNNALSAILAAHSDTSMQIDELKTFTGRDFSQVCYSMTSGVERGRMTDQAQMRTQRTWRTLFFSTGEMPIPEKIKESGGRAYGGDLARIADIPCGEYLLNVVPKGFDSEEQLVTHIKSACGRYFGSAGPAFIEKLCRKYDNGYQLQSVVKDRLEKALDSLCPEGLANEQKRVVRRFALVLVGGHLAVELGVLHVQPEAVEGAVRTALAKWLNDESNIPTSLRSVLSVQRFIASNPHRFGNASGNIDEEMKRSQFAGFLVRDASHPQGFYLLTDNAMEEACGAEHSVRSVAQELLNRGYLKAEAQERLKKRAPQRNGMPNSRFYWINSKILEELEG